MKKIVSVADLHFSPLPLGRGVGERGIKKKAMLRLGWKEQGQTDLEKKLMYGDL